MHPDLAGKNLNASMYLLNEVLDKYVGSKSWLNQILYQRLLFKSIQTSELKQKKKQIEKN